MSAVATSEPRAGMGRPQTGRSAPRLFESGEVRLEDVVLKAWEDLVVDGRAGCPVCGGSMSPGGCASCGSELS